MKTGKACYCDYFEKYNEPSDKIFKHFKIIAVTKEKNKESTTVLQCPECKSYYLLNIYNPIKPDDKALSINKYTAKIEDEGLVKILNGFSGILLDKDIDTYSEVYTITKQAIKNMNPNKEIKDENKN